MEEFFSEHIVKNTYIPPRNQVCTGFRFSCFWMEAGIGGKNGIVDQLDFTLLLLLSQVWPTQQLWWMSHLQEYITNSKTVPALNSKVYSLLQRWWKNSCRQWGPFFSPHSQIFRPTSTKQCCPLIFCQFMDNLFLFQTHEKVKIFLECCAMKKRRGSRECVLAAKCI